MDYHVPILKLDARGTRRRTTRHVVAHGIDVDRRCVTSVVIVMVVVFSIFAMLWMLSSR